MSDDFNEFKDSADVVADEDRVEPTNGNHTALLARAVVVESQKDGRTYVICEWQTTDLAYYWSAVRGVTGGAKGHTHRTLTSLGIDLDEISSWDELGDRLAAVEGQTFMVEVSRNGNFVNTRIIERVTAVQTAIPVTAPPDPPPKGGDFDDDDIPF